MTHDLIHVLFLVCEVKCQSDILNDGTKTTYATEGPVPRTTSVQVALEG